MASGVILWINGPFGAGKTSLAFELHRRMPGSHVFDPEEAGFYLRRVQPAALREADFQDDPLWRQANLAVLGDIARRHERTVIVPMTLCRPEYYDEVIGGLRAEGLRVDHYALVATRETLLGRLWRRGEGPRSWAAQRIDPCLAALSGPPFEGRIKTDNLPVPLLASEVARRSGLDILPPDRRPGSFALKNLLTSLGHIRL